MTHPMPEINTLLRQLRLSHIVDNLPQRNRDAIANKLAYPEFLSLLLQDEMLGRDNNKFKASDIEFKLPKPSYTIDTLTHLKEKYPIHNFTVIMGSDSFTNLKNWKNYQLILRDYDIVIYKRPGFEIDNNLNDRITILNAPLLEISATAIRENIKEGKSIQYLVCDAVNTEISNNGYYK